MRKSALLSIFHTISYRVVMFAAITGIIQAAPSLTEVFVPQYIQGIAGGTSNSKRLPYAFRVALSGLTANATYRYYNAAVVSSDGATSTGAGGCIFVTASGNFVKTTAASLSSAGNYGTFTTDASGNYTGWFILESTASTRFATAGNLLFMRIILNDGNNGINPQTYLTTTSSATVTAFNTSGANTGTGIRGTSYATDKNFVLLYDNTAGTGRPIAGTVVEADGAAESTANSYAGFYGANVDEVSGAWGAIIPNNLSTGIQRIEQRAKSDGSLVAVNTDTDGIWPSGVNTVNPAGSDSGAKVIATTDAPLNVPTTDATGVAFSNVTNSSLTVTWTSGNGANRIVVAKAGGAPTGTPVAATAYTASATYGSGTALGDGYVVYNGSGNSFSLTGLSGGTSYYLKIFEYNGASSSINYYTTGTPASGSQETQSTEPTTHVGSFAAVANSSTSIGLSWTPAAGATGYLILQRAGAAAPTGIPTDATAYSVGNTIGDGTVAAIVTSGATAGVTLNSLSANSQYSYAIFPFASDGVNAGTYNYYTAATVPTASATTSSGVTPTISVDKSSLVFGTVLVNGTSTNQTYTVSGLSLTTNITITAPPNFEVSTASGSGFGNSLTLTQTGGTVANTTIYVHFKPTALASYADNITNTSSGGNSPFIVVSGAGAMAPAVTTQTASAITTSGATLNGTVATSNNAVILDRGFYWRTSAGVSAADTKTSEGGTDVSAFAKALTGFSANTIYYYRAYAANVIGTTLGSADTSFYTLANTPAAPVVNGATTNTLNVAIGFDGNPAGTFYAIQETNSGNYVQANGTLNPAAVYQTASAWGTTVVTNLSPGTMYFFQVQATNGAGVATAFGPVKSANTANQPFTPGNLVVYRVGDGSTILSATSAPVFLDEYNVSGTRIQSLPLPTTSGGLVNALVASGNTPSEGLLTRSVDGRYLTLAGYKVAVGTASVATTTATAIPRVVARVDNSGNIDTSTALTDFSSSSNPRGVASADGTAFWVGGGAGGVRYATLGATTSADLESGTLANVRQVNIFSNQLYLSTASSSYRLATIGTGTPTTSGQPVMNLPGFPTSGGSPYGFFFCTLNGGAGPDTVYVADDGATTGIQKYCLVGGSWALLGTITATNVRSITASVSGATVTLYGSTGGGTSIGGNIYTVTDTAGYNAAPSTALASTIATATANMAFRGVAFAPKYSQTILPIAATVTKNYGDSAYSVATTASSGLTVTYASDNLSVATVNSNGTVTIVGAGSANIFANQAGNDAYAAAQVSQMLTVNKIAPTFKLISSSNPSGYKSGVTFNANTILPADVTGTIQFITNGGKLGSAVTISSGSAVSPVTADLPRAASNIIKAIYSGDANYLSITNALTQIVTNHPPVANANAYTRGASNTWRIAISDLLANASDVDGDPLMLIALGTSADGIILTTNATLGFVQYTNPNFEDDQFSYTVIDSFGAINTAVITLTFGNTNGVGGQVGGITLNSGTANLTFTGLPGYLYNVQVSTNLTSWNTLWTTNAPSSGVFQFTDNSTPPPAAYYRLMWNGN